MEIREVDVRESDAVEVEAVRLDDDDVEKLWGDNIGFKQRQKRQWTKAEPSDWPDLERAERFRRWALEVAPTVLGNVVCITAMLSFFAGNIVLFGVSMVGVVGGVIWTMWTWDR